MSDRPASHLGREIREQPQALAGLLERTTGDAAGLAASLRGVDLQYALLAARGSSDNAARYAQYLFGVQLGLPVALAAPSLETMYDAPASRPRRRTPRRCWRWRCWSPSCPATQRLAMR